MGMHEDTQRHILDSHQDQMAAEREQQRQRSGGGSRGGGGNGGGGFNPLGFILLLFAAIYFLPNLLSNKNSKTSQAAPEAGKQSSGVEAGRRLFGDSSQKHMNPYQRVLQGKNSQTPSLNLPPAPPVPGFENYPNPTPASRQTDELGKLDNSTLAEVEKNRAGANTIRNSSADYVLTFARRKNLIASVKALSLPEISAFIKRCDRYMEERTGFIHKSGREQVDGLKYYLEGQYKLKSQELENANSTDEQTPVKPKRVRTDGVPSARAFKSSAIDHKSPGKVAGNVWVCDAAALQTSIIQQA